MSDADCKDCNGFVFHCASNFCKVGPAPSCGTECGKILKFIYFNSIYHYTFLTVTLRKNLINDDIVLPLIGQCLNLTWLLRNKNININVLIFQISPMVFLLGFLSDEDHWMNRRLVIFCCVWIKHFAVSKGHLTISICLHE